MLRFDVAGAVPFGSTVPSAALGLKLQAQSTSEALTPKLYRLNRSFGSGASWNSPWAVAGGDIPAAADCQSCPLIGGPAAGGGTQPGSYAFWWIPDLVAGWANANIPNFGMLVKADAPTPGANVLSFASNETAYGSQPFIDIQYNPPPRTGEYPQSTLESQALTDRSSINVNVANGNLLVSSSDLQIAGTGVDLVVERSYNSLSQQAGSLGKGWKIGTGQDVVLHDAGVRVTVQGASGELLAFDRNPDGTYASPPGLHGTLTFIASPPPSEECRTGACQDPYVPPAFELTDHASGETLVVSAGSGMTERLLAQRDRYGNSIGFSYDQGKLASIVDTQGRTVTVTHSNGRIERLTDWTGRSIRYGYDTQGRLATYTDAAGKTTTYGYDGAGRVDGVWTPGGRTTKITYDAQGRVKTLMRTNYAAPTTGLTTTFTYTSGAPCAAGETKTVVADPEAATSGGHTTTYCSDTSDRVTKRVDADSNSTAFTFGATGDVASVTRPRGGVTNYGYDTTTRVLRCVQQGVSVVQDCLSGGGGLKTVLAYANSDVLTKHFPTQITNPQGHSVVYCYNGATPACGTSSGPPGSLQSVTNALSAQAVTRFGYDIRGNLRSTTDPRGFTTTYGYDAANLDLRSIVPPAGAGLGSTTIGPDALSRTGTVIDGKLQTATYTYDNLDRVRQIQYRTAAGAIDRTILYGFDDDGLLRSVTDPAGTSTYDFDDLLRIKNETAPSASTTTYTYDGASNLKTLTDVSGTTTYTYNGLNQLTSMREPGDSQQSTFAYDNDGHRTQIAYPSGVTVNSVYRTYSGRIDSVTNKEPSGGVLRRFNYTYVAPNGIDTELPQRVTDEAGNTTVNTYDAVDRITDAVTSGGPNPSSFHYELDGNGNRTRATVNFTAASGGSTTVWRFDNASLPCWWASWSGQAPSGPFSCSSFPSFPGTGQGQGGGYSHDANGNDVASAWHENYSYNSANQPSIDYIWTLGTSGSQPLTFHGAGLSELLRDGSRTLRNNLLGVGSRGTTTYYYADDGTVISERPPAAAARRNYLYDGEGSVIGLTSARTPTIPGGELTTTYRYDPYGHPSNTTSLNDENPFGYRGAYSPGTAGGGVICPGLSLRGGRIYNAMDGRYTQRRDVVPSAFNSGSRVATDINLQVAGGLVEPVSVIGVVVGKPPFMGDVITYDDVKRNLPKCVAGFATGVLADIALKVIFGDSTKSGKKRGAFGPPGLIGCAFAVFRIGF